MRTPHSMERRVVRLSTKVHSAFLCPKRHADGHERLSSRTISMSCDRLADIYAECRDTVVSANTTKATIVCGAIGMNGTGFALCIKPGCLKNARRPSSTRTH